VRLGSVIGLLFFSSCSDESATPSSDRDVTAEVDLLGRGQYLVDHVATCSDCHTPRDAMGAPIMAQYMAGAECFVRLQNGSCLHTSNLTNHETGLKNRTDAEIKRMIKDGMRPTADGEEALFPVMSSFVYHNLTDADLDAIVAYLRTVPGVVHEVPRRGPDFDVPGPANAGDAPVMPPRASGRRGALGPAVPLDPALIPEPVPGYPEQAAALRGRYLATQACLVCHTGHLDPDPQWLDYGRFFAGGEEFDLGLPAIPYAKNITSDPETGIGDWSVEDIVKVIELGTDKHGDGICPPMASGPMGAFGGLTDRDTLDIAHYIKSLPPLFDSTEPRACAFPPQ
jgi:mono/diheme cytochrome c family protein